MNVNNVTYLDSFAIKCIPKEIKKLIGNKNIIRNIYRIQAYDSIMCGYLWIFVLTLLILDLVVKV